MYVIDPERLLGAPYLDRIRALEEHVRRRSSEVLARLGDPGGPPGLQPEQGVPTEQRAALAWLRDTAASTPVWDGPPPVMDGVEASVGMIDHVADHYVDFLRGARSGLSILMKGAALDRLIAYFSTANLVYGVHNLLAVEGIRYVAARMGRPLRMLELGTGTGGASLEVASSSGDGFEVRGYTLSDAGSSLLGRVMAASSARAPGLEVRRARVDFDQPLVEQGIPPGSVDVAVAVNSLHNARSIPRSLEHVREVLADDGALVLSESLCDRGASVHQEFLFNLLPVTRSEPSSSRRFLDMETWRDMFAGGWAATSWINPRGPQLAGLVVGVPRR